MSGTTALAAITGPLIGLLVVLVAYCLGIFLSIKCCKPNQASLSASTMLPHSEIIPPGPSNVDIFIVSRSEDYLVNIPRPTFLGRSLFRNEAATANSVPAYEEPPTYEECVRNGLA